MLVAPEYAATYKQARKSREKPMESADVHHEIGPKVNREDERSASRFRSARSQIKQTKRKRKEIE